MHVLCRWTFVGVSIAVICMAWGCSLLLGPFWDLGTVYPTVDHFLVTHTSLLGMESGQKGNLVCYCFVCPKSFLSPVKPSSQSPGWPIAIVPFCQVPLAQHRCAFGLSRSVCVFWKLYEGNPIQVFSSGWLPSLQVMILRFTLVVRMNIIPYCRTSLNSQRGCLELSPIAAQVHILHILHLTLQCQMQVRCWWVFFLFLY